MLGKLQALALIIRADTLPIDTFGRFCERLVDQPADNLPIFKNERDIMGPDLEHGASPFAAARLMSEARVEKPRIVNAEFADQWIERDHLGGVGRRDAHRFLRCENIELPRIKDE